MAVQAGRDVSTEYTHYISIDFGTSGCGIAMATKEKQSDIKLVTAWEGVKIETKCPTILLLNPSEEFESFGFHAMTLYEKKYGKPQPEKADDYLLFQKFKMHLYKNPVSNLTIYYVYVHCILKH